MPPPLLLKPSPKEVGPPTWVLQPSPPSQDFPIIEQEGPECMVMASWACREMPSTMSISPLLGQEGPTIQKAGQMPHWEVGLLVMAHNISVILGDLQLSRACGQGLRPRAHGCIAWCS